MTHFPRRVGAAAPAAHHGSRPAGGVPAQVGIPRPRRPSWPRRRCRRRPSRSPMSSPPGRGREVGRPDLGPTHATFRLLLPSGEWGGGWGVDVRTRDRFDMTPRARSCPLAYSMRSVCDDPATPRPFGVGRLPEGVTTVTLTRGVHVSRCVPADRDADSARLQDAIGP